MSIPAFIHYIDREIPPTFITRRFSRRTAGVKQSYRYVFWFEVGLAAIALLLMVAFVRVDRAKSEMTADEKEQLRVADVVE